MQLNLVCPVHGNIDSDSVATANDMQVCGLPEDGEHIVTYPDFTQHIIDGLCGQPLRVVDNDGTE